MFLRNRWYCAALSSEIGREPLGRMFLDEPVVLYRTANGEAVALADRCCHRRVPLSKGVVEGDRLRCNYHGFLYAPSGLCVETPGQDKVPPGARVQSYPLCERHGWVWIWMGEAQRADPALVPDFHKNVDPDWASVSGRLPVLANYLLLVDNLMDLSHIAFLHAATIGSQGDTNPELTWDRGEEWVRVTRTVRDIAPSARMRHEGITCNVDQKKVMTYTPPANVVIDIWTTEAGMAPGADSRLDQHLIIFDTMTPETDATCHYFWASARNYYVDDREYTAFAERMTCTAFNEDKDMLEAQQRSIDLAPDAPMVDVSGDVGGLQARRLLDRLIAEEQAARAAAE